MIKPLKNLNDLYGLSKGDQFHRSDRKSLFTGKEIGNTYQKGINWHGDFPNLNLVILRSSNKKYGDRWMDEEKNFYLYYLMIEHRNTSKAKINYRSKENKALIDQKNHNAPILLTIVNDKDPTLLDVAGYFKFDTLCLDNEIHNSPDSVLLKRVDSNKFEEVGFENFCKKNNQKYITTIENGRLKTKNSTGKARSASIDDIFRSLNTIYEKYELFEKSVTSHKDYSTNYIDRYMEGPFRKGYEKIFDVKNYDEIYGWATEQTPSFTETLTKLIGWKVKDSLNPTLKNSLNLNKSNLEILLKKEFKTDIDLKIYEQVVLQPSANKQALANFDKTIKSFTDLEEIAHLLSKSEMSLLSKDSNSLGFWGIKNVHPATWDRLKEGSLVLFFADKTAFAACTLGRKFKNKKLANFFWGKQVSFSYMYSVTDMKLIDIPQSVINRSLGYKDNFVVQGFQVLNNEKSSILLSDLKEMQGGKSNAGKRGYGYATCLGCDRTMIEEEISEQGFCPTC